MELNQALQKLSSEKKYLVAVSGGVDSMVLLDLFCKSDLEFSAVHCNFHLREEDSELDQQLVEQYCNEKKISLYSTQFNTLKEKKKGESIEMVARNLRYCYFQELMQNYGFNFLVTAHHLNDQAETFFINLLRGSGLKGLAGMPDQNYRKVLRPLLSFSKKEIYDYAKLHSIIWREDLSNQTDDYLRNQLRHQVIPQLEKINPSFLEQLAKSQSILRDSYKFIQKSVIELENKILIKQQKNLKIYSLPTLIKTDFLLVYHFFSRFGLICEKDIQNLLIAKTGSKFQTRQYCLWINREELIVEFKGTEILQEYPIIKIESLPFHIEKSYINLKLEKIIDSFVPVNSTQIEIIDYEKVKFPLEIRKWKEADYFYPLNGKGRKKISKYLKDLKLSRIEKEQIYVLTDNQGVIIWLINYRLDNRFKLDKHTKEKIVMTYNL